MWRYLISVLTVIVAAGCSEGADGDFALYGQSCVNTACASGVCLEMGGGVSRCGQDCSRNSCPNGDPCVKTGTDWLCKPLGDTVRYGEACNLKKCSSGLCVDLGGGQKKCSQYCDKKPCPNNDQCLAAGKSKICKPSKQAPPSDAGNQKDGGVSDLKPAPDLKPGCQGKPWRFQTGGLVRVIIPTSDGGVYAGSYDGSVYSIDRNGYKRWSFKTGGKVLAMVRGKDGLLTVGSDDGKVYVLDAKGKLKWKYATGGSVRAVARTPNGSHVAGSEDKHVYMFDAKGNYKWKYETKGLIQVLVVGPDLTIYAAQTSYSYLYQHFLYALNSDGTLRWKYQTKEKNYQLTRAADGTLYLGSQYYLWAFDGKGKLKWKRKARLSSWGNNPVVRADGSILYITWDHELEAVTSANMLLWSYNLESSDGSLVLGTKGAIHAAGEGPAVHTLNSQGKLTWTYKVTGKQLFSLALDANGWLHVGDDKVTILDNNGVGPCSPTDSCFNGAEGTCVCGKMKVTKKCGAGEACQSGKCTACTSNHIKKCFAGSVHWYDSCGRRQGLAKKCKDDCLDGACDDYCGKCNCTCYSCTTKSSCQGTGCGGCYKICTDACKGCGGMASYADDC